MGNRRCSVGNGDILVSFWGDTKHELVFDLRQGGGGGGGGGE